MDTQCPIEEATVRDGVEMGTGHDNAGFTAVQPTEKVAYGIGSDIESNLLHPTRHLLSRPGPGRRVHWPFHPAFRGAAKGAQFSHVSPKLLG